MFTNYSLRVLYEISRNPRLRRPMTGLSLSFPTAEYMNIERHCRRRHKFGILCDTAINGDPGRELDCLWDDIEGNEQAIHESCSRILEAVLDNFKCAGITPKIFACSCDEDARRVGGIYGMSTLKRQAKLLGLRTLSIAQCPDETAVSLTLVAIARTHFPVASLDISGPQGDRACEPQAFGPMVAAWDFPWVNLTTLITTIHSSNLQADLPKWTAFQSWLSSLRALQVLDIGFEWPGPYSPGHEDEDWVALLDVPPWRRLAECLEHAAALSTLRIGIGRFGKQDILCLLESLSSRLRSLEFDSCSIVDDQNVWHDVCDWIVGHTTLEILHVRCVSNDRGDMGTASGGHEFMLAGPPDVVKTLLLQQKRTMHFTDDLASAIDGAEADDGTAMAGEDEYGPDFNDSDLQIADQVEPYG
nr:hypothetical protein B0A51_01399 [Rachicladosporium sp. CCFEE 5018]